MAIAVAVTFKRENRIAIGEFFAHLRPVKTANIAANSHLSASVINALEARQAHYQQRQTRCVVLEDNLEALHLFSIVRKHNLFRFYPMGGLMGIHMSEFHFCPVIRHPVEDTLFDEMSDIAFAYINAMNTKDS